MKKLLSRSNNKIRCLLLPYDERNPYQCQLAKHLSHQGFLVSKESTFAVALARILINRTKADILHLHWIRPIKSKYMFFNILYCAAFVGVLLAIRLKGVKIVWSVHNYVQHDSRMKRTQLLLRSSVANIVDAIIVHSPGAKERIVKGFRIRKPRKVSIIPHGNYIGCYSNNITYEEARSRLGFTADANIFLFFGAIRPYKGISQLVEAFRALDDTNTFLMIVGPSRHEALTSQIYEASQQRKNIIFRPHFVPDDEVQTYMNACDAVILPYAEGTLTSGAAVLAMSFGRACIAPKALAFESIMDDQGAILYEPADTKALLAAIKTALENKERLKRMGKHNYRLARAWDWNDIAKQTADIYRGFSHEQRLSLS